ncbi:hypothetical protein NL676_021328 [Syzygium grande]|nr:hypothetical protein NL676_021328 [Syzygium grande]
MNMAEPLLLNLAIEILKLAGSITCYRKIQLPCGISDELQSLDDTETVRAVLLDAGKLSWREDQKVRAAAPTHSSMEKNPFHGKDWPTMPKHLVSCESSALLL